MKISEAITILSQILEKEGDLTILNYDTFRDNGNNYNNCEYDVCEGPIVGHYEKGNFVSDGQIYGNKIVLNCDAI